MMPQEQNTILTQREGRITLALQACTSSQLKTVRSAAAAYNVPHQRLADRINEITFRPDTQLNSYKFTTTEETTIVRYVLNLDARGFALWLCEVADIADKLLATRSRTPVGEN
jgi:hypothetical protein